MCIDTHGASIQAFHLSYSPGHSASISTDRARGLALKS